MVCVAGGRLWDRDAGRPVSVSGWPTAPYSRDRAGTPIGDTRRHQESWCLRSVRGPAVGRRSVVSCLGPDQSGEMSCRLGFRDWN